MKTTETTQAKLAALYARVTLETLIESFEATDSMHNPEIPTVRGWMMDEMERRNPRTGEMFTSPAKKVVKITPAKVLRDAVNA